MIRSVKMAVLLALLGLISFATPAFAAGPLNNSGELDAYGDKFMKAIAGNNPMVANEAIATMGLILAEMEICQLGAKDFNLVAFAKDIVSGGGQMTDFKPGSGKHSKAVLAQKERWKKNYGPQDPEWSYLCYFNPYRSK